MPLRARRPREPSIPVDTSAGNAQHIVTRLNLGGSESVLQLGVDRELQAALAAALPDGALRVVDAPEGLASLDSAGRFDAAALIGGVSRTIDGEALFRRLRSLLVTGGRLVGYGDEENLFAHVRACVHGVAAQQPYARYITVSAQDGSLAGAEDAESQLFAAGFSFATCRIQKLPGPHNGGPDGELLAANAAAALCEQLPADLHRQFERDVADLIGRDNGAGRMRLVIEAVA